MDRLMEMFMQMKEGMDKKLDSTKEDNQSLSKKMEERMGEK